MKGKLLKIFYNGRVIQNQVPANFKEKDSILFENDLTIHLPQSGLYILKNVFVTNLGVIYKNLVAEKENIICYDLDFKKYKLKYFLKSFLKFRKLKYTGNKAIIIFDNYSGPNGFAHWICDGLTRLAEVNDKLCEYTVIVPSYFKEQNIYSQSLNFFNVTSYHYLENDTLTYFNELYFPSHIGDTGNFHPDNIKKLKSIINSHIELPELRCKNIYISRAKANRRFVENESDVVKLLNKYDFEVVYMEDHSFTEQIKIVKSALNIISIHGAALTMLMFAEEGTAVLELRSETDRINNMYFLISNVCKLNYSYLACKSVEQAKTANNFNITVNMEDLQKAIEFMKPTYSS